MAVPPTCQQCIDRCRMLSLLRRRYSRGYRLKTFKSAFRTIFGNRCRIVVNTWHVSSKPQKAKLSTSALNLTFHLASALPGISLTQESLRFSLHHVVM